MAYLCGCNVSIVPDGDALRRDFKSCLVLFGFSVVEERLLPALRLERAGSRTTPARYGCSVLETDMTPEELSDRQLDAYNRADLDAFCSCYAEDVRVYFGEELEIEGLADFRSRYEAKFAAGNFGATVPRRLVLGSHCVDEEHYWSGLGTDRTEGVLLVSYTLADGKISRVRFLD